MLSARRVHTAACSVKLDKKSGGPLQGSLPKTSGYERSGGNYGEMFKGLQTGIGL